MREKRLGLAVWVKNSRAAKNLRKFGNIHYVSRRLNYISMYVPADTIEETIQRIRKFDFVTRIERSHRHEIPREYNNSKPDKAKEYDYKLEEAHQAKLNETVDPVESRNEAVKVK